jgi:hypothetical protein
MPHHDTIDLSHQGDDRISRLAQDIHEFGFNTRFKRSDVQRVYRVNIRASFFSDFHIHFGDTSRPPLSQ